MSDFLSALSLVVLAEMGDKTQLLAMAMSSKYKASKVMLGVLIATVLNHALAVAAGTYLNAIVPEGAIKIVAAISFLLFGLWTLRGDKLDDDKKKASKFGPVVTVAIAFFIAEMGDKTQIMTISIAAKSSMPLFVLMGTTVGMLVADGIGILGGAWMAKNVPERYIKWGAGVIFLFFGTLTLYESVPKVCQGIEYIVGFALIMGILIYLAGVKFAYRDNCVMEELPDIAE